jgi:hypothetical protein
MYLEECKSISISDLKRLGYLGIGQNTAGVLSWKANGAYTGSVSVRVNTDAPIPFLELDYRCDGFPIKYLINLVEVPSNLRHGKFWLFVCPRTGYRCRKLFLVDRFFLHRSALKGAHYEKQYYSKRRRNLAKEFDSLFRPDKAWEIVTGKNFKKYYNGKPTKRYLKVQKYL